MIAMKCDTGGVNAMCRSYSQALLVYVGSVKPKTTGRDKDYHNGAYQLSLLALALCMFHKGGVWCLMGQSCPADCN